MRSIWAKRLPSAPKDARPATHMLIVCALVRILEPVCPCRPKMHSTPKGQIMYVMCGLQKRFHGRVPMMEAPAREPI